jgi:hypothetical protein
VHAVAVVVARIRFDEGTPEGVDLVEIDALGHPAVGHEIHDRRTPQAHEPTVRFVTTAHS